MGSHTSSPETVENVSIHLPRGWCDVLVDSLATAAAPSKLVPMCVLYLIMMLTSGMKHNLRALPASSEPIEGTCLLLAC